MQRIPTLDVRLLGGFEVRVGDQLVSPVVWRQRRAAAIVKLLALEPGYRLHREQLLDLLWPDLDPESGANNLRVSLHHARGGLLAAGAPAGAFLGRDGDVVALAPPEAVCVDVDAFDRAVARAWTSIDPGHAEQAAGLYRGELLPDDRFEDWAGGRREAVRVGFLSLLARLSDLYEARGDLARAVATRERALAVDPLDEGAQAAVMRLHARMGNPNLALAQYARYAARLERELGATPERDIRELAAAIKQGDPAPATPSATPRHEPLVAPAARLPAAVDALIGRDRELAELERLLAHTRILTLTGPGGIGKTRLALETARTSESRYPDGVGFVDLAHVRDPALLLPAVAHALGVGEAGGQPLGARLTAAIGNRRLLLVLDNLEQVAAAAPDIAALAAACPHVTVLATSRVRLRLRGEQEYPVLPLPFPGDATLGSGDPWPDLERSPAVALFTRRAQAARPSFRLTPDNADAVIAVCRRLDGLPLAIELAAARVRVLTPAQLVRQLARPLDVLGMTAADVPERQRTLRDTIAWSDDMLAPREQILFRRLAAFAGGCTLEQIAALAAKLGESTATPLEPLAVLIDHSLVLATPSAVHDASRYTMLETIREYAGERLRDSGEANEVHRAFESMLLDFAERAERGLLGPEQTEWLDRIQEEHDNLRAVLSAALQRGDAETALTLATRLTPFWRSRGYALEANAWLENALAWASDAPKHLRAAALDALGGVAIDLGEYDRADRYYRAGVELWWELGDRRPLMQGLYALAIAKTNAGDFAAARASLDEALAIARELQDERGIAAVLHNLGMLARENGEPVRAIGLLEDAMAIWRQLGDPHWIAVTSGALGDAHRLAGDAAQARAWFAESARLYERLGDRFGLGVVANQRGLLEQAEGRTDMAMQSHAEALRRFDAVHAPLGVIESIEWLATAAAHAGHVATTLELFGAAAAAREAFGFSPLAGDAVLVAAGLERARTAAGTNAAAALAAGAALTLDQARDTAFALAGNAAPESV